MNPPFETWIPTGSDRQLATLWDGFGSITSRLYTIKDAASLISVASPSTQIPTIVKRIQPPSPSKRGVTAHRSTPNESFARKMVSYKVERYVYETLLSAETRLLFRTAQVYSFTSDSIIMEDLSALFPLPMDECCDRASVKGMLRWLALFHAWFWGRTRDMPKRNVWSGAKGVWERGCYWELETRGAEFSVLSDDWKRIGREVHAMLERVPAQFLTLCHGDAKTENCLVRKEVEGDSESNEVAMYDFQYVGVGVGMKDVVYLLCTSGFGMTRDIEEEMLQWYFKCLQDGFEKRTATVDDGITPSWELYTREIMMDHYELCMIDWLRFMLGWGLWGDSGYVKERVAEILKKRDI
ncbi:hypothetical protein HDU99_005303 [Rhizoclosmatium hyalinum]|nr:hypothetical protein HDU99_005303 [Rhizoclosmatium hyalinum]